MKLLNLNGRDKKIKFWNIYKEKCYRTIHDE